MIAAFVLACGDTPAASPEQTPPQPAAPAASEAAKSKQDAGHFAKVLDNIERRHKAAKGREGILAEEKLYSNFDEELIIRDFFEDRREGFFLDVGCANPIKGSNTYYIEKHLGWTGIGVDALEEYAPKWAEIRPTSRFRRHLVSDRSGEKAKFFKSYGRGISSTDKEWASGKAFGVEFPTEEIEAETITLDDLLEREGVTSIDLLSMDIEGHEPKALVGFDIQRFSPALVVIEKQADKAKGREVAAYFEAHGYERISKYIRFDRVNDYYQRNAQ